GAASDGRTTAALTEQLFLYADDTAAADAMTHLTPWLNECGWVGGRYTGFLALGPQALWGAHPTADRWQGGLVSRPGNAIFVLHASGDGPYPGAEDLLSAQIAADQLCKAMNVCDPTGYPTGGPTGQPQPSGSTLPDPDPYPSWWSVDSPQPSGSP